MRAAGGCFGAALHFGAAEILGVVQRERFAPGGCQFRARRYSRPRNFCLRVFHLTRCRHAVWIYPGNGKLPYGIVIYGLIGFKKNKQPTNHGNKNKKSSFRVIQVARITS